jgi:hypothetical protein
MRLVNKMKNKCNESSKTVEPGEKQSSETGKTGGRKAKFPNKNSTAIKLDLAKIE